MKDTRITWIENIISLLEQILGLNTLEGEYLPAVIFSLFYNCPIGNYKKKEVFFESYGEYLPSRAEVYLENFLIDLAQFGGKSSITYLNQEDLDKIEKLFVLNEMNFFERKKYNKEEKRIYRF